MRHTIFALPFVALAACAAPAAEDAAAAADELAASLDFHIMGTTNLQCDGGPRCTLVGSIRGVDAPGRPSADFATYLAGGEPGAPADGRAVTCALTFGAAQRPIGEKAGAGCLLPVRPDGAYDGFLRYTFALDRDELATALAQNVTLTVRSRTGITKLVISFAIAPHFQVQGGSAFPADTGPATVATPLPADAYRFAFERAGEQIALRVRRTSDGGGRWVSLITGPSGTHYEATAEEGVALYDRTVRDGIGQAAKLSPRLFVDEALARTYWKVRVERRDVGDFAQVSVTPRLDAAPYALGTQGGREGYSHDPGDDTGLSGCEGDSFPGVWTCDLRVRR